MKLRTASVLFFLILLICQCIHASGTYELKGRIIDKTTRLPISDATVLVFGHQDKASITDSNGIFTIKSVLPGIYKLSVSCIGFESLLSAEYIVGPQMPLIELELEEKSTQLAEVTVKNTSLRK